MPKPVGPEALGEKHGKLTLLALVGKSAHCKTIGRYACDCGNTVDCIVGNVRSGGSTSCGCHKLAEAKARLTVHGATGDPRFQVWVDMKKRCYSPRCQSYKHYGGRGIAVDERWLNDPLAFFSDMGERPAGGTLERRNNELGYGPDNCYWATMKEQQNNKRTNIVASYKGRAQTLSQWAEEFKLSRPTVFFRYHKGFPLEVVFFKGTLLDTQYSDNGVALYESHGVSLTVSEWHKVVLALGETRSVGWLRQKLLNTETEALRNVPEIATREFVEGILGYPLRCKQEKEDA